MTRQEKLYDDYENALFALLMDDVAIAQGQQALAENERLKADPSAVVPGDLHTRCVRTVRRKLAAGRRYTARKTAFRLVSRVAVVLMALMLTLTVAFAASPAMQTSVVSWAVEHYSDRLKPAANSITITSHPQDITAAVGTTARFTVAAVGRDLSYQWQVKTPGGKWLSIEKNDTDAPVFHITAAAADNGKLFRCVITDGEGGVVVSDSAVLTVGTIITRQPMDVCEAPGKTVSFSLEADGPRLSYQWQVRTPGGEWADCLLPGSDTPTLTVDVTPDRAGQQFCCVITDANGSRLVSDTATLTLGIVITRQPADASAAPGEKVTFIVAAEGQDLVYQWQTKTPGGSWADCPLPGNGTPTLTVEATAGHNGEQYRCVITDAGGSQLTSDAATLTLSVPLTGPIITRQPADANAAIDAEIVFSVAAEGQDLAYQWQFRRGAEKWVDYTDYLAGNKTPKLIVKMNERWNGCQLRCAITDASGNKTYSDPATVTILTVITKQPKSVAASRGESVSFAVTATGVDLVYQWQAKAPDSSQWTATSSPLSADPANLYIEDLKTKNNFRYRCVITDANNVRTISDEAVLTVLDAEQYTRNQCGDNLFWSLDDSATVLTISGTGPMWDFAEREYLWGGANYEKVVVENGVTSVGSNAFRSRTLQSVVLSSSVTAIGDRAFYEANHLTDIVLPPQLQRIGAEAFSWCRSLTELVLPDSVTFIGSNCFYKSIFLHSLRIPAGLTVIGPEAFRGSSITSVVIPNSVTSIGEFAFHGCNELQSLQLGSGVTSIGAYAFAGCSLSSIDIPDQVTTIGEAAFRDCPFAESLRIGNGVTYVGDSAFIRCSALTDVTLGSHLERISNSMFSWCDSLQSITIPTTVKSIGIDAFWNCSSLSTITFLGSAPSFSDSALHNVTATAYYPAGDSTWTADVKKNYLGHITWVSYNK